MKVSHVFEHRERLGDLLADAKLTTFSLLGALQPEPNYPTSPAPIRLFSDRFDLLFPNDLAESVLECCVRFGCANELDFEGYDSAQAELNSMRADAASAVIRSPWEVWRERGPHAERWMTLQRATLNKAAALDLLQIASTTHHFEANEAEDIRRYWRWIAPSGGFQLAIVRQWESPYTSVVRSSGRRPLLDAA
ncbi:hypothetical protein J2W39_005821 [Variovorax paradoxus]|uniref:Uncharacterized protein n=1 Tax=Variovorax paradoxus TaxID=34073 RepID=A0AAW8EPE9_VARPD|nr:hypothetical protein [Variovorax paradoxus]MDP9974552.1 hypothetical protein [Variovorax paradoxus]